MTVYRDVAILSWNAYDDEASFTERAIGDLQDFIAESKFGWGEWRVPTERA
ncbi:hypothetical protein [Curtobacterium sp. RRHDQ10]|uniref:hypothetical protein n=1 Tax=Curtobacterium phyllosphaerae TaxID=3413379 RepID=UPI003BEFD6A7